MCLTRVRWLTAVCLSLGISPLIQAQEWRPVARSVPPAVIASSGQLPAASPAVTIGRPVAAASDPAPAPVVVRASRPAGAVVRGQSPDPDSGSPYPPPVSPVPSDTLATPSPQGGPYSTQDGGRFNAPAMGGVTLPLVEMPPVPTSGDPAQATPPPPPQRTSVPVVSIGLPRAEQTRTVSATEPAFGPVDPPPPAANDRGTAPVQPTGTYSPYSSTSNQPDSVPPPGVVPPADIHPGVATDRPVAPGFWEKCGNMFNFGDKGHSAGRCSFQSDHSFDSLSSPVTMPFYAEDPRALTEVKPIFMYQKIPGNVPAFGGGSVAFFGTQARLALTERWSIVMSELGFLSIDPKNPVLPVQKGSDFSDFKIGGKYTFLRSCESGTVAAFGINVEFPLGGSRNLQDNGTLSIDPYFSFGQTFGRLPGGFGSLNFLNTTGYSASVDNSRAEFFYSTFHLDYNVANANKFFPLIEMNYIHYTTAGNRGDFGTEGADLLNLGSSTRRGSDYLSFAAGVRYRFSECIQAGTALEVPVSREHGLSDYRLTFDVIFRY
jgi:hypothetical protein